MNADTTSSQDEVDLDTISCHEAAHAVMRWLRGTGVRELTATLEGGASNGTGRPIDGESYLLITFAGFAYEYSAVLGMVQFDVDGSHGVDDFDDARMILTRDPSIRLGSPPGNTIATVEESMQWWLQRAADELLPYHDLVEHIGARLAVEGRLSGRSVAAMCREWRKRSDRIGASS